MTVTIVLGKATDGYVDSYDASYAAARSGPGDAVIGGQIGWTGQNNNDDLYRIFQTFIGFDYSAVPATEMLINAQIHLSTVYVLTPTRARSAEIRGYGWSSGGFTTSDWRNAANLSALTLQARAWNVHQSNGKRFAASQDSLVATVPTVTSMEFVVVTDRQTSGAVPTEDEGTGYLTSEADGTASDPALVYTTVTRSRLVPVLGCSVKVPDGGTAYLTAQDTTDGTSIYLWRADAAGAATYIDSIPLGDASSQFARQRGAQGFGLAVDDQGSLYVIGRLGGTQNTLAGMAYVRSGLNVYSRKTIRSANLPSYDGMINNIAATWHPTASGRIMALVGHNSGSAAPSTHATFSNDLVWVLLDTNYLRNGGGGGFLRGSGSAVGTLVSATVKTGYYGLATNEAGTSLDVVAAGGQNPDWGFTVSVTKAHALGNNSQTHIGRYIINSAGTGMDSASTTVLLAYGVKDANAKLRVLRISDTVAAVISVDSDVDWGLAVSGQQYSGATPAPNELGFTNLGGESITNLPSEATMAKSNNWDAVFNEVENRVWIYYVDSTLPNVLRRTAVDLSSFQPLRNSVIVTTQAVGRVITSVRLPRNASIVDRAFVDIGYTAAGVAGNVTLVDAYNLAPTPPVLNPQTNYDATLAKAFTWTFQDPNPGDTQSAYQLQILDAALGTTALDTGKVTSTVSSHNVAGGTLANSQSYQWRVMTWDAQNEPGGWSDYGTFQTSAGGVVTVTYPATDNPQGLDTDDLYVTWSVTGTVQASYRVILRRVGDLVIVQDTGWVTSTATTALVAGMVSDVQHRVEVQVRNAALVLSGIGQRLLLPSYSTPEAPVVTLAAVAEHGYILVSVNNPLPGQPEMPGSTEYGFEDNSTAVWDKTGCTFDPTVEQIHTGTRAAKLVVTGTPTQAFVRDYAHKVPVVADIRYTARMWVYRPVAGNVSAVIDWFTAGDVFVSGSGNIFAVPAATWTLIAATGTCPAGATKAAYGPSLVSSPATGTVLYVDDMAITGASDRPDVVKNQILRREAGSTGPWDVLGTIGVDASLSDYEAGSGKLYEYKARGITA
jgi:hypothetical protein